MPRLERHSRRVAVGQWALLWLTAAGHAPRAQDIGGGWSPRLPVRIAYCRWLD